MERRGEIFREKREVGDASESLVLYRAGPSSSSTAVVQLEKGQHRGNLFSSRPRWLREPEKVRHRWRMGDGESRLVALNEVGGGRCSWVRQVTQGGCWITQLARGQGVAHPPEPERQCPIIVPRVLAPFPTSPPPDHVRTCALATPPTRKWRAVFTRDELGQPTPD